MSPEAKSKVIEAERKRLLREIEALTHVYCQSHRVRLVSSEAVLALLRPSEGA